MFSRLPGRTFANNKIIWLCNAHQADSIVFPRSLLAKSASIQTVVCFPCLGGVIELGITEKVMEDHMIIQQIRSSFKEMPYPKLSKISRKPQGVACTNLEQHEILDNNLDQMEEFEKVKVCSPKNSLNGVEQFQQAEDSFIVEGRDLGDSQVQSSHFMDDEISDCVHNSTSPSDSISQNLAMIPANVVKEASLDFRGDDIHYQGILSTLFKNTHELILGPRFRNSNRESSFVSWRIGGSFGCKQKHDRRGASQVLLKKALFEVAKMHAKCLASSPEENGRRDRLCGREADETEASNVLAERRRREKMNQRFSILGSLVPSIGKADKVSVLDSTIKYLKELERRVEELESSTEVAEKERRRRRKKRHDVIERTSDNYYGKRKIASSKKPLVNKRKACAINETENENQLGLPKDIDDGVIVSISDKNVSIKIRCPWRENLLFEIMGATSNLQLDSYSVQFSNVDGVLSLVIRSKLKSCTEASEETIRQALERIIGKCLRHSHWNL